MCGRIFSILDFSLVFIFTLLKFTLLYSSSWGSTFLKSAELLIFYLQVSTASIVNVVITISSIHQGENFSPQMWYFTFLSITFISPFRLLYYKNISSLYFRLLFFFFPFLRYFLTPISSFHSVSASYLFFLVYIIPFLFFLRSKLLSLSSIGMTFCVQHVP